MDGTGPTPDAAPGGPPPALGAAYWRLWTASGLSNLADGVLKVALPLVAVRFTRSPTLIAGLTTALTLPWLLFALHAGAFADRLDRRRAMLGTNLVRAALPGIVVTAVVLGHGSLWMLYVVALGIGVAETLYDTSAQSIVPQIVSRQQLARANGRLYAAELAANEFVGPPLGGALVAAGAALAFITPAALWLVAVGALLLVRGQFRIERYERTTIRADVAEGLRFLRGHRLLRRLAVMVGVFNFAGNAMWAVLVLYAVGPASAMGLSEPAYGWLLTATAAGSLVGSLVAVRVEQRLGRARSLVLTILAGAVALGMPAVTADPFVVGAAFFANGAAIMIWNIITVTLRQQATPDRLLGRVNSAYRLVAWGTRPIGAAFGGLLAHLLGLRAVFVVASLLTLALLAAMTRVTNEEMEAAEGAGGAD
jgi:MFS family permease